MKRTMRSGVATPRRAVPRSPKLRSLLVWSASLIAVLAIALLSARDAIERQWLVHTLSQAFGGDVTIGSLHHTGSATELDDVKIATTRGTVFAADALTYRADGDAWEITPARARLTIPRATIDDPDVTRVGAAAHDLGIARATFHLTNAQVVFVDGERPLVEFDGIAGTLRVGDRFAATLDASWIDDVAPSGASAISARSHVEAGVTTTTVEAASLPLAGLVALLGSDRLAVTGGVARDLSVRYDGRLRATMRLDGVALRLGAASVDELTGPLVVVDDGLGSGALDGFLEPGHVPLALTGEVHDVHRWTAGSRDLRLVADMVERIAAQPALRWSNVETTAPGIVYGQYAMTTKDTPHVVQLIVCDPAEPTLHFDTALADDHVISKGARTSDLGIRTSAVAGVNGDYFDIGRTYEPQGLLIRSGTLVHGPTDHEALVIDKHNHPTFARFHFGGSVVDGTRRFPLTLYNSWPTREVAFITPDYGPVLSAAPGVTFAALAPIAGTRYRVTRVQPMTAAIPTELGLGFGDDLHEPPPRAGDIVDVRYALDPPVDGVVAGIGSGPLLLKDGAWYEDKHAPAPDERDVQWPVVAVGAFADGTIVFVAVDGRHPERSIGMTRPEFAELMRGLGVRDAMAFDSGGSVTMVARSPGAHTVSLHNVPSDNSAERYVSDALFAYSSAPEGTIVTAPRPHAEPSPLAK
jgi:exopolysaccharide biosynthesis protein